MKRGRTVLVVIPSRWSIGHYLFGRQYKRRISMKDGVQDPFGKCGRTMVVIFPAISQQEYEQSCKAMTIVEPRREMAAVELDMSFAGRTYIDPDIRIDDEAESRRNMCRASKGAFS